MSYNAVLFDLDGTLLDTLEDLGNSMNRVLITQGFPTHPLDAYRYFVGDGITMLVTRTLPEEQRHEAVIQRCMALFREDYGQNWKVKTRPYDGVPEMLDALEARGLKLTILSNKPHEFTKQCVAELLPSWHFDIVLGQRDAVPRKPDPAGAIEIAEVLNIVPSEFLYLGDTANDMQTAVAARMFPVGVLWGFRTRQELLENGAQVLLDQPLDILTIL
jgi:phosphoglycolate phosphatase